MKYLITGGCGFLGSNLASAVLKNSDELIIFDNLSRTGSENNLSWLKEQNDFFFYNKDIRKQNEIENVVKEHEPEIIFHLAGQVAMTTSIENPRLDFEINTLGSFNLMEALIKHSPDSSVIYSSTNKVYGDLEWLNYKETETRYTIPDYPNGLPENIPLEFHSPYGCSKGAADQYFLDFFRIYGLKTVIFRHSSMFGGHQYATYDQGWIGWFCQKAIEIQNGSLKEPLAISGSGKQVRDILYSTDLVNLYFKSVEKMDSIAGNAFNIGGGVENSLSLIELFSYLEKKLDITIELNKLEPRKSDQKVFIADNSKISKFTSWIPQETKFTAINKMINWLKN